MRTHSLRMKPNNKFGGQMFRVGSIFKHREKKNAWKCVFFEFEPFKKFQIKVKQRLIV